MEVRSLGLAWVIVGSHDAEIPSASLREVHGRNKRGNTAGCSVDAIGTAIVVTTINSSMFLKKQFFCLPVGDGWRGCPVGYAVLWAAMPIAEFSSEGCEFLSQDGSATKM